jgi:hypothetical protein
VVTWPSHAAPAVPVGLGRDVRIVFVVSIYEAESR